MQSGITASQDLLDAFNKFTSTSSLFALPITITGESLTPESALPFTSSSPSAFADSLPTLQNHLEPKTPKYLILRLTPQQNHDLVAITYVPSTAPVRQKMLFASTRNTLVRDLGLEKFGENLFFTDDHEILDPAQWAARAKSGAAQAGGLAGAGADEGILSTEERELQSVKRAEEEERHGTGGRDLMGTGGSGSRLAMRITGEAKSALSALGESAGGTVVQLGIEVATETLELLRQESGVQPGKFLESIPSDRPSYSFYAYPGSASGNTTDAGGEGDGDQIVFLYTCPGSSKVKERMVYASARMSMLLAAKGEGVSVSKRLEQGDVGDITAERLAAEVGVNQSQDGGNGVSSGTKQGFARPKRPGRK